LPGHVDNLDQIDSLAVMSTSDAKGSSGLRSGTVAIGLTETSEQVLQAANIVIAPVIPSPLSRRALGELARFLVKKGGKHPPMLPVFSMVDRRRSLHLKSLEEEPNWPVVPMASAIEQMAVRRAPLGAFAPNSPSAAGFNSIWGAIEKRLCR
jgi:chromosome partitioning protein